jgi:hypothetical protein
MEESNIIVQTFVTHGASQIGAQEGAGKGMYRDKFYTTLDKGEHNTMRHEINCLLV